MTREPPDLNAEAGLPAKDAAPPPPAARDVSLWTDGAKVIVRNGAAYRQLDADEARPVVEYLRRAWLGERSA